MDSNEGPCSSILSGILSDPNIIGTIVSSPSSNSSNSPMAIDKLTTVSTNYSLISPYDLSPLVKRGNQVHNLLNDHDLTSWGLMNSFGHSNSSMVNHHHHHPHHHQHQHQHLNLQQQHQQQHPYEQLEQTKSGKLLLSHIPPCVHCV